MAIRWATVGVGLVYAAARDPGTTTLVAGVVLVVHALFRTLRPLRYYEDRLASLLLVLAEVALTLGVVVATDYWRSPYVFSLATAIVAAGFARGFAFAIRTAVTAALAVAIPWGLEGNSLDLSVQWGGELLLVAIVAGYARRLFGEAEERTSQALSRMHLLSEANQLLHQLHQVAQTLPASLDLREVVDSTVAQVRDLVRVDVVAVLLWDPPTLTWRVAGADGARLPRAFVHADLPLPLQAVSGGGEPLLAELDGGRSRGLGERSALGAYVPLRARSQVIGLLAAECRPGGTLGERELGMVAGLADQAALAIDNARWFGRIRTVGADEERTRIARDLHDRVGQSLAYLAFELDRLRRQADGPMGAELDRLRGDVRRVVGEVRDTLHDLRTDVSEEEGLVPTLAAFLDRVRDRTGRNVTFQASETGRLPLPLERELWRIAQEAVTNAERHADASRIDVRWAVRETVAELEVRDDGRGFEPGTAAEGSYGLIGMRERADAIGATVEVRSRAGAGTTVLCRLERA